MDRSPLRRGQETVYHRWGDNTAILSGDAMSIEAYAALSEVENKSLLSLLLPRFSQMALEVCIGQQYDMEFETRTTVRVEEYMEMIRLKTSVLLGSSLELGALVGGATEEQARALYEVGIQLGLAFQMKRPSASPSEETSSMRRRPSYSSTLWSTSRARSSLACKKSSPSPLTSEVITSTKYVRSTTKWAHGAMQRARSHDSQKPLIRGSKVCH